MGLFGGGNKWAKKQAKRQRRAEEKRRKDVTESRGLIDKRFEEFDDGYFGDLRSKAREYYQPQFQDQYDNARRSLRFSLARSGNSRSSAGANSLGDLARDRSLGLARIEDLSTEAVDKQRGWLEDNRQQMYAQAAAATDPQAAASQQIGRSEFLSRPQDFSVLGALFENTLGSAATFQKAQNRGDRLGWGAFGSRFGNEPVSSHSVYGNRNR